MTNERNYISRGHTSDMLGHSDIRTTAYYLDSLSIDESFRINNKLLKRKNGNGDKKEDDKEGQFMENDPREYS